MLLQVGLVEVDALGPAGWRQAEDREQVFRPGTFRQEGLQLGGGLRGRNTEGESRRGWLLDFSTPRRESVPNRKPAVQPSSVC